MDAADATAETPSTPGGTATATEEDDQSNSAPMSVTEGAGGPKVQKLSHDTVSGDATNQPASTPPSRSPSPAAASDAASDHTVLRVNPPCNPCVTWSDPRLRGRLSIIEAIVKTYCDPDSVTVLASWASKIRSALDDGNVEFTPADFVSEFVASQATVYFDADECTGSQDYGGVFDRGDLECADPFTNLALTILDVDVDIFLQCLYIFELPPTIEKSIDAEEEAVRLPFVALCHAMSASQSRRPVLFGGVRGSKRADPDQQRRHPTGKTFIAHLQRQKAMLQGLTLARVWSEVLEAWVRMPNSFTVEGIDRAGRDMDKRINVLQGWMGGMYQPVLDDTNLDEVTTSSVDHAASIVCDGKPIGPCETWTDLRFDGWRKRFNDDATDKRVSALVDALDAASKKGTPPSGFVEEWVNKHQWKWTKLAVSVSLPTPSLRN
eukprot:m.398341 g.398341  ORF g.398341 m.398341 type:complete len:436 (-) comp28371_c0_seq6:129-1436(-)